MAKDKYKVLIVSRLNKAFYKGEILEISSLNDTWDDLWDRSEKLDRKRIIWGESSIIKVSESSTILKYSKDD
jgi:hypothetical protein